MFLITNKEIHITVNLAHTVAPKSVTKVDDVSNVSTLRVQPEADPSSAVFVIIKYM